MKDLLNFLKFFVKRNKVVFAFILLLVAMYAPLAFLPAIYLSETTVSTLAVVGKYAAGTFIVVALYMMNSIWYNNLISSYEKYKANN